MDQQQIQFFKKELTLLFELICSYETNIEENRQLLVENEKFDVYQAFQRLDKFGHGYVSSADIKNYFNDNKIILKDNESDYVVFQYASDPKIGLSFKDFLRIVLPVRDLRLREVCLQRRRVSGKINLHLPFYVDDQMSKLLALEIDYFRKSEQLKTSLMDKISWNVNTAFKIIDAQDNNITMTSLKQLLKSCNKTIDQEQYKSILCRLSINDYDYISKEQFYNAILPNDLFSQVFLSQPKIMQIIT